MTMLMEQGQMCYLAARAVCALLATRRRSPACWPTRARASSAPRQPAPPPPKPPSSFLRPLLAPPPLPMILLLSPLVSQLQRPRGLLQTARRAGRAAALSQRRPPVRVR